jgi:hypothetical protein
MPVDELCIGPALQHLLQGSPVYRQLVSNELLAVFDGRCGTIQQHCCEVHRLQKATKWSAPVVLLSGADLDVLTEFTFWSGDEPTLFAATGALHRELMRGRSKAAAI